RDELDVNIDDPRFSIEGSSKGKRLAYFLRSADRATIHKTLVSLWNHRMSVPGLADRVPLDAGTENAFRSLVERFGESLPGKNAESIVASAEPSVPDETLDRLATRFLEVSKLAAQPRGYAFEAFLKEVFDLHGLQGKKPFRLTGEQIDGSFELDHDSYLFEAKWQNQRTSADDLRNFQGKVKAKAAWSRGLFVSYSGFTEDGLDAFTRGSATSIICMDGLDLYEIFRRRHPFVEVLRLKRREASDTGRPFVSVRDLFPNE
ncbi:MAG: restriction endonuclease, partial [Verrucomicrobiae bacterium]|nr:restriction endonuclease [Verrucomicrobiae bacterium]